MKHTFPPIERGELIEVIQAIFAIPGAKLKSVTRKSDGTFEVVANLP